MGHGEQTRTTLRAVYPRTRSIADTPPSATTPGRRIGFDLPPATWVYFGLFRLYLRPNVQEIQLYP